MRTVDTMAPFKCPNCRREFPRKIQFDRHLERKTPCSPDEYDQCLKCNRQFYMKKEYLEHVKLCNGAEYEALTRSDTEPVVVKKIEDFTKEELYEEYLRARGFGRKYFEFEDDSFLLDITVSEIKDCISLDTDCRGVIDMFVMTNMNSKLPDNHNVRYTDDYFEVLRKKGWRRIDQDDLVYRVLLKNRLRFYDIETQLTEILGEAGFKALDGKLDEVETMVHETSKGPVFQALKEKLFDVITSAQQSWSV